MCKEGSKINQIIFAILINIPVFCYGASIGWMSPMVLLLQSKNSPRDPPLDDSEISWMASACFLTCVPSNFLFAVLCDKCGRKFSAMFASLQFVICWIIKLCSTATWAFILARAMVGIGMAGCYLVSLVYIKEISEVSLRGTLGTVSILSQTIGNLLLYILGDFMGYHALLWLCLSIPIAHIVIFMFMPESPAYLVKRGKIDKATKVMSWLRKRKKDDEIVTKDVKDLQDEQNEEGKYDKFVLKTILKTKLLRRAFGIAMFLTVAREACGAIPVLNYAGDIFHMASGGGDKFQLTPNQQAMILGSVQVVGCLIATALVERTGRKPLLIVTSFVSGISMLVLATWFLVTGLGQRAPGWIPVLTLCLCIFCDASGLQPVCFVVLSELFAYKHRSTVTAITLAVAALADFLQMLFFKKIATSIGVHVTFYFFGVICILSCLFILFFVPETKNRSLDQIYRRLRSKSSRVRFSKDNSPQEAPVAAK